MVLKAAGELDAQAHGILPFEYLVEVATAPEGGFADPRGSSWAVRLAKVHSISLGYGSTGQSAVLSMVDPTVADTSELERQDMLTLPAVGDAVRITLNDGTVKRVVFKGLVADMHEQRAASGSVWNFEVASNVIRLDDQRITALFNPDNDPIHPSPRFNAKTGYLVQGKLKTVYEIVTEIMGFADAWGSPTYFGFEDINWHGLDTSAGCGQFIPSECAVEDLPQGEAILQVLQKAGNYTYVYDPATDTLHIVALNRRCDQVGPQWRFEFPPTDAQEVEDGRTYAYELTVKEDRTQWSVRQAYNVCRLTSGPIEWYSGNWMVPERANAIDDKHCVTVDSDTATAQKARSFNPDRCYYRFSRPKSKAGVSDLRTRLQYPVGMPLFPDWNIFEDWLPALFQIGTVQKAGVTAPAEVTATNNLYQGKVEFQAYTQGDQVARGETHIGRQDNLRAYQAWFATDPCPACHGTGLVKKLYNNSTNTPTFQLVQKGPADAKHWVVQITNYLMKPNDFGQVDDNGVRLPPPAGLEAWVDGTEYPLPWKNTCPYCRGVGLKPEYKIRHISQMLFAGRNNQASLTGDIYEIPIDYEATMGNAETWEMAANRVLFSEGPLIEVEVPIGNVWVPQWAYRNYPEEPLRPTPNADPAGPALSLLTDGSNNTANQKVNKFPHPLAGMTKNLAGVAGLTTVQATDPQAQIVPSDWTCEVPFTTIMMHTPVQATIDYQMGRVLFAEPLFIPCRRPFTAINVVKDNVALVDSTGLLATTFPGRGYHTADEYARPTGFWRPARVWMHFCYNRPRFYDRCQTIPGTTTAINPVQVTYVTPEGEKNLYEARAMILDGRYALEVRKLTGSSNELTDTSTRVLQYAFSDPNARVQVYEPDFWKLPVAPQPDLRAVDLASYKLSTAHLSFAYGRAMRWDAPSPGERLVQMAGYTAEDDWAHVKRPRLYRWTMWDNRARLLGMAIRRLEEVNNIQVSGSLVLVNQTNDTSQGLGWVDYPGKGKATVIRVTYNFGNGFTAELELHREEARIGEMTPKEKERQNLVERELVRLRKNVELREAQAQSVKGPTPHDQQNTLQPPGLVHMG